MGSLCIVKPLASQSANATNPTLLRLLTPDPKEAGQITSASGGNIILDYGTPVAIDSAFLGYHTGTADQQWYVAATDANGAISSFLVPTGLVKPLGYGPPYHTFVRANPITSRYWQVAFNAGVSNTPWSAGVLALGLAFQPTYGTEYGAGRFVEDTGSTERLFGGGFGIDDGVGTGGYQWTFGDLQPDELRTLYQLVRDRRTTRSVLIIEDPAQTAGLNERLHWGLFSKLEAYERLDPLNTKWALTVQDWG